MDQNVSDTLLEVVPELRDGCHLVLHVLPGATECSGTYGWIQYMIMFEFNILLEPNQVKKLVEELQRVALVEIVHDVSGNACGVSALGLTLKNKIFGRNSK